MAAAVEELGRAFLDGGCCGPLRDGVLAGTVAAGAYYQQLLCATLQLVLARITSSLPACAEGEGAISLLSPDPDLWDYLLAHALARRGDAGEIGPSRAGWAGRGSAGKDLPLAGAVEHLVAAVPAGAQAADLGLLYESMLQYSATMTPTFRLVCGKERKQGGSYYTPPSLVAALIESALAPVLEERLRGLATPEEREAAVLRLRVCDPACGCGHFLLAATRHLARALLRARAAARGTASGTEAYQAAVREVVANCICGVDRDPLAVALCRLILRAESASPVAAGHIKHGDSLLGAIDLAAMPGEERAYGAARPPGERCAFQWSQAFPAVFAAGGFDVVLANPPWEILQPEEVSFFAARGRPDIAALPGVERKAAIAALTDGDPGLLREWHTHREGVEAISRLIRQSGRFPLSATGKLNLSSAFVETIRAILHPTGRAGCIVPSGLVTDDGTKQLFHALLDDGALVALYHFDNRRKLFPEVSGNLTFCLMTLNGAARRTTQPSFAFFLHHPDELGDPSRLVPLLPQDLALLNPNTRTCPIFRSRRDASLTSAIHHRVPILVREGGANPWNVRFRQGVFNMTSASHLFRRRQILEMDGWTLHGQVFHRDGERCLPLYEAKMLHHFDHRWAHGGPAEADTWTEEKSARQGRTWPRYWVPEAELDARLAGVWNAQWLVGYRLVCRSTDERSVLGTVLPRVGCGNSVLVLFPGNGGAHAAAHLVANLNSLVLDYQARQKLGGINLNFHVLKQLPVLPPAVYREPVPWAPGRSFGQWVAARVLELVFTDHTLQPFARDLGYRGDPFPWQTERRHALRCELDAAYFYQYSLTHDDAAYVLDTFAGLRRKEIARFGEYRSRRIILELLAWMLRESAPRPGHRAHKWSHLLA